MDIYEDLPMAEAVMCFSHIGTRTGKVTAQECYNTIIYEWRKYIFMGLEETIRRMLYDGCKVDDEITYRIEDLVVRQLVNMFTKISNDEVDVDCFNTAITDVINWMSQKQRLRTASDGIRRLMLDDMKYWISDENYDPEDDYLAIPDDNRWLFLENLTSIEIPEYMEHIPDGFFSGFSGIENLSIPERIEVIAGNAFVQCINLRTINLPKSLQVLGNGAFCSCENLQHIFIPENDKYVCEGDCLMQKNERYVVCGCANSRIPEDAIAICNSAFTGNICLTSISFPDTLKYIGSFAFAHCPGLQDVVIPKNVKKIYDYAFYHCTGLRSVVFEGAPELGCRSFAECCHVKTLKGLSDDNIVAHPLAFNVTKDDAEVDFPAEIYWKDDSAF